MEDINLEVSDMAITCECDICYVTHIMSRKYILNCCMCQNFNMCVPCFLIYSDDPRKFGNGNVSCPYCRAPNGFAYWSILDKYNKRENMWKAANNMDFTNCLNFTNLTNMEIMDIINNPDVTITMTASEYNNNFNDIMPPLEEAS